MPTNFASYIGAPAKGAILLVVTLTKYTSLLASLVEADSLEFFNSHLGALHP
jgi:hypothetical protein